MEAIYLFIGLVVGGAVLYIFMSKMLSAEKAERADDRTQYESRIATLSLEKENAIANAKAEAERIIKQAHDEAERHRREELSEIKRSYMEQIEAFKSSITASTESMLRQRSSDLQEANSKQVQALLAPLRENITKVEQAINHNNELTTRNSESFEKQISQMMLSSASLTEQAQRLTNALQRDNKAVGNWGELILSELLESQGLISGLHFDLQQTLRDEHGNVLRNDETGKRMIPDAILHLADNRDVVIDSKMSFAAFVEYQNAKTDHEREEAIKHHIQSVRNHVKELKDKDYSSYIGKGRRSCGFVMMFIPIEGALQLAISSDQKLWNDAFADKVFIVGAQTLMAALRIIDLTWVNVQQQRNTQEILETAGQLVDRVSKFYSSFEDVKKKIEALSSAYDNVTNAVSGRQGILTSGRKLTDLGVRGKKELPKPFDEEN